MVRRIAKRILRRAFGSNDSRPVEKEEPTIPEDTTIPEEEELPDIEVTAEGLEKWSQEERDFQLIDIREKYELRQGYLANAWLIPMNEIPERLENLPKNRSIVIYCAAGMRSFDVTYYLRQNGFEDSWSLEGGGASFAHRGWLFPEDGRIGIGQKVHFSPAAIAKRNLPTGEGYIQHISKEKNNIAYLVGQYSEGEMKLIENVSDDEFL